MTARPRHQSDLASRQLTRSSNGHPESLVPSARIGSFDVICPRCGSTLTQTDKHVFVCPADEEPYRKVDGVWRFLLPEREEYFRPFLLDYEAIRRAEGRGSADPAYYRSLPEHDSTGRFEWDWRIRSQSYRALISRVIRPRERRTAGPLNILDLGAGNCWLSGRLAERGHHVASIDLVDNDFDGLGCRQYYEAKFSTIQAEFERLPFASDQFDLAIFNGSFHYATDYPRVIKETLRVLAPNGEIAIMDSPVYRDESSGVQMIRERESQFERDYGFPSNQLASEGFLSFRRLDELSANLGVDWQFVNVWYGLRWALRPLKARLFNRREPARFLLIRGTRSAGHERSRPKRTLRMRALRKLARLALSARYQLTQRHRHRQLTLEHAAGFPILVLRDVFNPVLFRTGKFLAETLNEDLVPRGSSVLDMGTGTGLGAIASARWADRVTAIDINPEAVRCANINVLVNHLEDRIEVRHGDLFDGLDPESSRFDVVLFNPPYYRGTPGDTYDHAWRSVDTVERFAADLACHLSERGVAFVALSSDGDSNNFLDAFRRNGFTMHIVEQRHLINETLTIYGIQLKRGRADADSV